MGFSTLLLITFPASRVFAFEELNEAQSLIYDRGHLANTTEGQTLTYSYVSKDDMGDAIDDKASLLVVASHDDGRRDVDLDFLSGDRHLNLPPFKQFRGNPIIIAMLEHIAQNMSELSGGGALYFRNRIRDALASDKVELDRAPVSVAGEEYEGTTLVFYPFAGDEHLADNELMKASEFSIALSDDVPGGVISVKVTSRIDDAVFERTLSLN